MWHIVGITCYIVCKTLITTAMKTNIYLSVLIVFVTVSIAVASSNEREESNSEHKTSMAELEFISQCNDLQEICNKRIDILAVCIPEVIILDRNLNIIACGVASIGLIAYLIPGSEFLAHIHSTDYYFFNYK